MENKQIVIGLGETGRKVIEIIDHMMSQSGKTDFIECINIQSASGLSEEPVEPDQRFFVFPLPDFSDTDILSHPRFKYVAHYQSSPDVAGKKGHRANAQLSFALKSRDLKSSIVELIENSDEPARIGTVFVIASPFGAIGSGIGLEIIRYIRSWFPDYNRTELCIVIPNPDEIDLTLCRENAYAFLCELKTEKGNSPSVDICSFFTYDCGMDSCRSFDELCCSTGRYIVLASHNDNTNEQNKEGEKYFFHGISAIRFPVDRLIDAFEQTGIAVLNRLLQNNRFNNEKLSEMIESLINQPVFSDKHFMGDEDLQGSNSYGNPEKDVERRLKSLRRRMSNDHDNPVEYAAKQIQDFEDTFRKHGIIHFYQHRYGEALPVLHKTLDDMESDLWEKVFEHGFGAVRQIIEQLIVFFNEKRDACFESNSGCRKRERNALTVSMPFFEKELHESGRGWLNRNKRFFKALENYLDAVAAYLENRIYSHASTMAVHIIETTLKRLKSFQGRIEESRNRLEAELESMKRDRREIRQDDPVEKAGEQNGSRDIVLNPLPSDIDIESLFGPAFAAPKFHDRLINLFEKQLNRTDFIYSLKKIFNIMFFEAKPEYPTHVLDVLMRDFPEPGQRTKLFQAWREKAAAFFPPEFDMDFASSNAAGTIFFPDDDVRKSISDMIQNEIEHIPNFKRAKTVRNLFAPENIFIMESRGTVNIEECIPSNEWHIAAHRFESETGNLPLHILSSRSRPIPCLTPLSPEKKSREDRENALVLACAMGLFRVEDIPWLNYREIKYQIGGIGLLQYKSIGRDWKEALSFFNSNEQAASSVSSHCVKSVQINMRRINTNKYRTEMGQHLENFLNSIEDSFEKGKDDPVFKRFSHIVIRVRSGYDLFPELNGA